MTPSVALAQLGLQTMPTDRRALQQTVAKTVKPHRWTWAQTEAYQTLWAQLSKPGKKAVSICSDRPSTPDDKRKPSHGSASEHPAGAGPKLGVYRPGMTRRPSRPAA